MKLVMLDNDECDIDEFELHEKAKSTYGYNLKLKKDQERLVADIVYTMGAFKSTGMDDDDDEPEEEPKKSPVKKSKKKAEKSPPKSAVVH